MSSKAHRAHELVKPAAEALVARILADTQRLLAPRHDPEAVHDFRVGLRRLRTVLRASRRLYGKKKVQRLIESFRRFADATNSLRDEEVLDETVAQVPLGRDAEREVRAWLERRQLFESRLREQAMEFVRGPELERAAAELAEVFAAAPRRVESAERFARHELERARAKVREVLPVERGDVEGLHRLRIRFKRLRYTAEMLGRFITPADAAAALRDKSADSGPNYAAVARLAARMQKVLGSLHDVDQALAVVAAERELEPRAREELAESLAQLRAQLADDAVGRLEDLPKQLLGA